ncbi:MAG TPA: hypothetical protein VGH67_15955 [Solirubrobacteraceae bacterium]
MHQLMGALDVGRDALPVSPDDIAAHDPGLDVRGPGAEHHDRDGVTEPVEVRRADVDDGDVGLLARRQAPDLVVEVPPPGVPAVQMVSTPKPHTIPRPSAWPVPGTPAGSHGGASGHAAAR